MEPTKNFHSNRMNVLRADEKPDSTCTRTDKSRAGTRLEERRLECRKTKIHLIYNIYSRHERPNRRKLEGTPASGV